jgi:hypothetical protein
MSYEDLEEARAKRAAKKRAAAEKGKGKCNCRGRTCAQGEEKEAILPELEVGSSALENGPVGSRVKPTPWRATNSIDVLT